MVIEIKFTIKSHQNCAWTVGLPEEVTQYNDHLMSKFPIFSFHDFFPLNKIDNYILNTFLCFQSKSIITLNAV